MKILFLTEFLPSTHQLVFTGGVEVRTFEIIKRAKKDFQVKVVSRSPKAVPATWLSVFPRFIYIFNSFFKALKKDFDLIEGSNYVTYLPAFLAGFIKKKKKIAWFPDLLGKDWFKLGFTVGMFGLISEKISLKLPWNHMIALSQSTKNKLIKNGINENSITVVKAGINPQEFNSQKLKKFPDFTIICIARLVGTKRVQDLIKAYANLSKKQTKLIIVGSGPKEKSLKKLVKSLSLNKVEFYQNLSRKELIELLKKSHLFCLPSVVEGFGIVTVESYACGLPAVLSDIPVNHEVTQNKGCLFFKPQNPKHLCKQLKKIISNPNLYQQKSKEARKISKHYTWDKIYQQTKKVYENSFNN